MGEGLWAQLLLGSVRTFFFFSTTVAHSSLLSFSLPYSPFSLTTSLSTHHQNLPSPCLLSVTSVVSTKRQLHSFFATFRKSSGLTSSSIPPSSQPPKRWYRPIICLAYFLLAYAHLVHKLLPHTDGSFKCQLKTLHQIAAHKVLDIPLIVTEQVR